MICFSGILPSLILAAAPWVSAMQARDRSQIVVPTESVVRVVVEQEASAILMGPDHQTRQKIQERVSFDGLVLDASAHIALFVGEYRPSLQDGQVRFTVTTPQGQAYQALPVGLDDRISLAILQAPIPRAHPVEMASGESFKHFNIASAGEGSCPPVVACVLAGRSEGWLPFLVLKVSGLGAWTRGCRAEGMLALDARGRLIGFVTHASPHSYNDKLAYTYLLPSDLITSSAEAIVRQGKSIPGGWLGIYLAPDTQPTVERVTPSSPAERAGLRSRDVILGIDGHKIRSKADLIHGVRFKGADEPLLLDVRRGQADERIEVSTGSRNPRYAAAWAIDMAPAGPDYPNPALRAERLVWNPLIDLGLIVYQVKPPAAAPSPSQSTGGFLVKSIQPESRAARAGFKTGDILLRINEVRVMTLQDLGEGIKQSRDGKLKIDFLRGGELKTSELKNSP